MTLFALARDCVKMPLFCEYLDPLVDRCEVRVTGLWHIPFDHSTTISFIYTKNIASLVRLLATRASKFL